MSKYKHTRVRDILLPGAIIAKNLVILLLFVRRRAGVNCVLKLIQDSVTENTNVLIAVVVILQDLSLVQCLSP